MANHQQEYYHNDFSNSQESNCCCLLMNPWLKCKGLWKKFFLHKKFKSASRTNLETIFNNNPNMLKAQHNLIIKCPNCHRKSVASIIRCTPLWQLSLSPLMNQSTSGISATNLIQTSSNTLACDGPKPGLSPRPTSASKLIRSPSNYCRVATCEKLHIHDLTPKCLETFAPSSTCSSCQYCDKQHIGPNHDQLLMVKSLLKELPLSTNHHHQNSPSWTQTMATNDNDSDGHHHAKDDDCNNRIRSTNLLMQWPLPEYRPQHSPDHLYRTFRL